MYGAIQAPKIFNSIIHHDEKSISDYSGNFPKLFPCMNTSHPLSNETVKNLPQSVPKLFRDEQTLLHFYFYRFFLSNNKNQSFFFMHYLMKLDPMQNQNIKDCHIDVLCINKPSKVHFFIAFWRKKKSKRCLTFNKWKTFNIFFFAILSFFKIQNVNLNPCESIGKTTRANPFPRSIQLFISLLYTHIFRIRNLLFSPISFILYWIQ